MFMKHVVTGSNICMSQEDQLHLSRPVLLGVATGTTGSSPDISPL